MKRKRSEVPWRRNWWNGFGRRNARPRISSGRATNKRPPGCGRPERKRPPIGAEFSMRRRAGRDEGLRSARAEGEAIRRAAEEEAASACRELTERAMARRDAVIRLAAERLLADDA